MADQTNNGDRCLETTTTTGTGNITTLGAVAGYRALSAAMTSDGDTADVTIAAGAQWEETKVTRVSATVYSRATPYKSSTGSAIDFLAGTKEIWIDCVGSRINIGPDGSVGAPAVGFQNDPDSGFYRIGANNIGLALNGILQVSYSTAAISYTPRIWGADGDVALPGFAFTGDTDSGFYRLGANNIGLALNGVLQISYSTTAISYTPRIWSANGDVSLPGMAFASDTDCGWYRIGANNIGLAVGGALMLDASATRVTFKGTNTNDEAGAGYNGEFPAPNASGTATTSGSPANVGSLSLTAGDWELTAGFTWSGSGSPTVTEVWGCISATSATMNSTAGAHYRDRGFSIVDLIRGVTVGPLRVSLAATTTYFAVSQHAFTTGTFTGAGVLKARRIR